MNKIDKDELPVINNNEKNETEKNKKESTKELNKIKIEKNYKKLENNYFKNTREINELKQDNNLLRFQLEDLSRKLNDSSSIGKGKKVNSKKKLKTLQFKNNNNIFFKMYNVGSNNSILTPKSSENEYVVNLK